MMMTDRKARPMIRLSVILPLLYAAAILVIGKIVQELLSEPAPPEPRIVEVGKTLAMYRMRAAGVEGDNWQNWTTVRAYRGKVLAA